MLSMAEVQNCAATCAVGRLLDHFKCRQWAPKNLETHPSDCCKAEKRAIQSSQFKKGSFVHKKILGPKSLKGSVHRMHRIDPTYNGMAQTDCLCQDHVELWIIMVSVDVGNSIVRIARFPRVSYPTYQNCCPAIKILRFHTITSQHWCAVAIAFSQLSAAVSVLHFHAMGSIISIRLMSWPYPHRNKRIHCILLSASESNFSDCVAWQVPRLRTQ